MTPAFFVKISVKSVMINSQIMSIYKHIQPIKLDEIKTSELASRPSKVTVRDFAKPIEADGSLKNFLDKLPNILAVQSLRELANQIRRAKELDKPIIWGIGGHIIKTGLAPVIIDLMKRGFVSAIASNGSVLVHDAEIALVGFTSEDVDATLETGDFGAAQETGEIINTAAMRGQQDNIGLGEALGREVSENNPKNAEVSLLCQTYKYEIPFTAHITVGADIGHFHSSCDGAALGATTGTAYGGRVEGRIQHRAVALSKWNYQAKLFLEFRRRTVWSDRSMPVTISWLPPFFFIRLGKALHRRRQSGPFERNQAEPKSLARMVQNSETELRP